MHSDINEPDTSDDEVARATATARRGALDRTSRATHGGIREQGKNKPSARSRTGPARGPRTTGRSEQLVCAAAARAARPFDADYEAEEAEEASPVRRRADSPAMPRARNETQIMLEEAARRSPRAPGPQLAPRR